MHTLYTLCIHMVYIIYIMYILHTLYTIMYIMYEYSRRRHNSVYIMQKACNLHYFNRFQNIHRGGAKVNVMMKSSHNSTSVKQIVAIFCGKIEHACPILLICFSGQGKIVVRKIFALHHIFEVGNYLLYRFFIFLTNNRGYLVYLVVYFFINILENTKN